MLTSIFILMKSQYKIHIKILKLKIIKFSPIAFIIYNEILENEISIMLSSPLLKYKNNDQ